MDVVKRLLPLTLVLTGLPTSVSATILTFDQGRDGATQSIVVPTQSGANVQQDYGDNVTGSVVDVPGGQFTYGEAGEGFTPEVVTEYLAANGADLWGQGYGDLTNVLFAHVPLAGDPIPDTLGILFSADPGVEVQLYHFDLAGWFTTDYLINSVTVSAADSILFSQSDVLVAGNASGPGHTEFDFASPLSAAMLLIEIDFSNIASSMRDNIGIDNIRFGQTGSASTIPLPASLWLFGAALIGLVGLKRIKNTRSRAVPGGIAF